MNCPRCQSALNAVEYDGEQIQVCSQCKGEWMASGELQRILDHHNEIFTPEEIASVEGVNKEIFTAEAIDHDELNCPQCVGVQMEHFNYGDTSGIILHKCLQCGGIWMDKDELTKVEEVVDGWKGCLNQDIAKYGPILDKIDKQEEAELEKDVSISRFGFVNSILRHFTQ
jgi:Zn-finger nucleic acid-binding protein